MNAAIDNQPVLIKTANGAYIVANHKEPFEEGKVNEQEALAEKAAHPNICILHLLFKVISGALYFLSGIISSSSLTSGLAIIIAAAFDFWIVKNITGRFSLK